jgi:hypothetical protein
MTEFNLSSLKSALLTGSKTTVPVTLFGTTVYLRRMTAAELIEHEEALVKAQAEGDARKASECSVQIIVDCLVTPDGKEIDDQHKPTAAELLAAHDNVALLDAIAKVKQHAVGKLEDAEKN